MVDHSCKKLYYVLVELTRKLTFYISVKPSCLLALRLPHITERSEGYDEMARDEARHGKALKGLLERYFG